MAEAKAHSKTIVESYTLTLDPEEASTLLALAKSVTGSISLVTVLDVVSIKTALLDAGVPSVGPLGTIDLGE